MGPTTKWLQYLTSVAIVWLFCLLLTLTGLEPEEGAARTDKAATMKVPYSENPYETKVGCRCCTSRRGCKYRIRVSSA